MKTKKNAEQLASNLEFRADVADMGRKPQEDDVLRLSASLLREQSDKIKLLEKFISDFKSL